MDSFYFVGELLNYFWAFSIIKLSLWLLPVWGHFSGMIHMISLAQDLRIIVAKIFSRENLFSCNYLYDKYSILKNPFMTALSEVNVSGES